MSTLDCHNVEQTFKSLKDIFGISREKIGAFLDECDPEPDNVDVVKWSVYALDRLREYESIDTEYDSTCWFHLTRGPKGTNFSDGLHPLGKALPELMDQLASIVGDRVDGSEWERFEKGVLEGNIHVVNLSLRQGVKREQGPFGWLVRDFAFNKSSKRDYMRKPPEAVEDLIGAIGSEFDLSTEELMEEYIRDTHSYIVKFKTNDTSNSNLAAALYYLLRNQNDMGLTLNCTTSCSMQSQTVLSVSVEEFSEPPPIV